MDEFQRLTELWAMANTPAYLNIGGLVLDIIGVIILFRFGLPADIRRGGIRSLDLGNPDPEEADKARRYDCWAWFGLTILIVGFLAQGAGSVALLGNS